MGQPSPRAGRGGIDAAAGGGQRAGIDGKPAARGRGGTRVVGPRGVAGSPNSPRIDGKPATRPPQYPFGTFRHWPRILW